MDTFYKTLGATIRTVRGNRGLSQEKLAAQIGVSFQMLQKYERGACRIPVDKLLDACNFLGVSMTDMLGLEVKGVTPFFEGMRTSSLAASLRPIITELTALADKAQGSPQQ